MKEYKNYYEILDIEYPSNLKKIKIGYKKSAMIWHPDRNPGIDTTVKMQDVIEAYLILKDSVQKKEYDIWYESNYRNASEEETILHSDIKSEKSSRNKFERNSDNFRKYKFDEWVKKAQKEAKRTVSDTVSESKYIIKETLSMVIVLIVLFFILFFSIKLITNVF